MIKAVIFDLDGTLLDTIEDIGSTCNQILNQYNYPPLPTSTYKVYVGKGVKKLMVRLFKHYKIDEALFDTFMKAYYQIYKTQSIVNTKAYQGIYDMLESLKTMGVSLSVLSNKPHVQVQEIIPYYFKDQPFDLVYGKHDGIEEKPNPSLLFKMMETLDLLKEEVLYVGDTLTDMETALRAGVESIGVLWGFRDREELVNAKATYIVSEPKEIVDILKQKNLGD